MRRSNITGMQMVKAERGKQGKERSTLRRLCVLKDCFKAEYQLLYPVFCPILSSAVGFLWTG